MANQQNNDWPNLAIGLYDKLTGRNAEIAYEFDDFSVEVPRQVGNNTEHALWKMNGTLKIRTQDNATASGAESRSQTANKLNQ